MSSLHGPGAYQGTSAANGAASYTADPMRRLPRVGAVGGRTGVARKVHLGTSWGQAVRGTWPPDSPGTWSPRTAPALSTGNAHLLQGDPPEERPSLGYCSRPSSHRRSPKLRCRLPNGSRSGEGCQGDSASVSGARRTSPWALARVGQRDAAERRQSPRTQRGSGPTLPECAPYCSLFCGHPSFCQGDPAPSHAGGCPGSGGVGD